MNLKSRTTEEDTWGLREYSLQKSVRLITHNPDMKNTNFVSCSCGQIINRRSDWHTMIANGTLLCRGCARCSSCRRDCDAANKRLVCIDGLILCHSCLENFGYFIEPAFRVKIDDPNGRLNPPDNANNTTDAANVLLEYKRKDRCKYMPKVDSRRPIRTVYYDRPSERLPDQMNPLITAPVYIAEKGALEKMSCPGCTQVATGSAKYVVAAMARVFHKPCFVCRSCKEPLSEGIQLAGKHFEYCTCEPPQVWCTKSTCKMERLAHHEGRLCWLGFLRPGGRDQFDTDISAQAARKAAAAAAAAAPAATESSAK